MAILLQKSVVMDEMGPPSRRAVFKRTTPMRTLVELALEGAPTRACDSTKSSRHRLASGRDIRLRLGFVAGQWLLKRARIFPLYDSSSSASLRSPLSRRVK